MLTLQQQEMTINIACLFSRYANDLINANNEEFYKKELFRFFVAACKGGYILHYETILDDVIKNMPDECFQIDGSLINRVLFNDFSVIWDEWIYAWKEGLGSDVILLKS